MRHLLGNCCAHLKTPFLIALAIAVLVLATGCGRDTPKNSSLDAETAYDDSETNIPDNGLDLTRLLEAWMGVREADRGSETSLAIVESFVNIAESDKASAIIIFDMAEAEFADLPSAKRSVLGAAYLARSGLFVSLCNHVLELATAHEQEGRRSQAERYRQAVARVARANMYEGVVKIGRMSGKSMLDAAESDLSNRDSVSE